MSSTESPSSSSSAAVVGASAQASRRRWLAAAIGGVAAVAGAGLAWRQQSSAIALSEAEQALWGATFDGPAGTPVAMQTFKGRPLILNFWATWCPPCVEELPLLNGFYRQHAAQGWQVMGLAIDQPSAVRKFLEKLPLEFPVALGGLVGTDLGRSLGNLTGGLPFTILLGEDGRILQRKMGQITPQDLQMWSALG